MLSATSICLRCNSDGAKRMAEINLILVLFGHDEIIRNFYVQQKLNCHVGGVVINEQ